MRSTPQTKQDIVVVCLVFLRERRTHGALLQYRILLDKKRKWANEILRGHPQTSKQTKKQTKKQLVSTHGFRDASSLWSSPESGPAGIFVLHVFYHLICYTVFALRKQNEKK